MEDIDSGVATVADETSVEYLGRWNRLVSSTNWEKGRIIHDWRQALIAADAPQAEYADDAWSRRVGQVTGQHVGRLRRVFDRFAGVREQYDGLYWSHFQASMDWDDAEMWLEAPSNATGPLQQMRSMRAETQGSLAESPPADAEPLDEDANEPPSGELSTATDNSAVDRQSAKRGGGAGSSDESDVPSRGDQLSADGREPDNVSDAEPQSGSPAESPFARLPELPPDLDEAFEGFKLAIIRHKLAGWQEISCNSLLAVLEALARLAVAPQ